MNIPENQIQAIIKILEEEESCLSDSYGYYCNRDTKLREIAIEIITQLDIIKKWEYTVGLIGGINDRARIQEKMQTKAQ